MWKAKRGWCWEFPFFQVIEALIIPQQVRLQLTIFPWMHTLLTRVLWCISKVFLFPSPCWKQGGLFSNIYCGNLVKFLKVNVKSHNVVRAPGPPGVYDQVPLEFLTIIVVHSEPPATCQLQFRFPTQHCSWGGFSLWFVCREAMIPCIHSPVWLSNLGGSGLPYVLPSLTDFRRVVDLQTLNNLKELLNNKEFLRPFPVIDLDTD